MNSRYMTLGIRRRLCARKQAGPLLEYAKRPLIAQYAETCEKLTVGSSRDYGHARPVLIDGNETRKLSFRIKLDAAAGTA
jgi:hypothetical protein